MFKSSWVMLRAALYNEQSQTNDCQILGKIVMLEHGSSEGNNERREIFVIFKYISSWVLLNLIVCFSSLWVNTFFFEWCNQTFTFVSSDIKLQQMHDRNFNYLLVLYTCGDWTIVQQSKWGRKALQKASLGAFPGLQNMHYLQTILGNCWRRTQLKNQELDQFRVYLTWFHFFLFHRHPIFGHQIAGSQKTQTMVSAISHFITTATMYR